jgi:hypothetical protein
MPALVPWLHPDQSEPLTPVLPMGSLQNLHRSLVVDGQPVAVGVQPIGDALCHTNFTFAYGASLRSTTASRSPESPATPTMPAWPRLPSTRRSVPTPRRALMTSVARRS